MEQAFFRLAAWDELGISKAAGLELSLRGGHLSLDLSPLTAV